MRPASSFLYDCACAPVVLHIQNVTSIPPSSSLRPRNRRVKRVCYRRMRITTGHLACHTSDGFFSSVLFNKRPKQIPRTTSQSLALQDAEKLDSVITRTPQDIILLGRKYSSWVGAQNARINFFMTPTRLGDTINPIHQGTHASLDFRPSILLPPSVPTWCLLTKPYIGTQ